MYYYQIQTQLFVYDIEYCDFCIWTFAESSGETAIYMHNINLSHFTLKIAGTYYVPYIAMKFSFNMYSTFHQSLIVVNYSEMPK